MDFSKTPKFQAAEITLYYLSQTLNVDRAIDCATFHVDGLIAFGNFNLLGFLDADIMAYLDSVKKEISLFNV